MESCPFCQIARDGAGAAVAWSSERLVVFADHRPIRPGHMQIIPRAHFETFDDLPEALASEIVVLGQRIARVQKRLYGVARVGFVFTGNEVAHVHAHVVPLHASDDITSARYGRGEPEFASFEVQAQSAEDLRRGLEEASHG